MSNLKVYRTIYATFLINTIIIKLLIIALIFMVLRSRFPIIVYREIYVSFFIVETSSKSFFPTMKNFFSSSFVIHFFS
jgi:hypothetical protein